jgi:CubicO group peptidase (beta-lactamase class C family)
METLIRQHVLDPLGLTGTGAEQTAWMPEPVLHAHSAERRAFLGIPAATPFIEESTYWDPSWTLTRGGVEYSTVTDMADSMAAIGRGDLLSPESHQAQVGDTMIGFGAPLEGCASCHTLDEVYSYGLGIVRSGGWLLQNPLLAGYGGTAGYHAGGGVAIAVVTTFTEDGFGEDGSYAYGNVSQSIFREIGELLMPTDPPLIGG